MEQLAAGRGKEVSSALRACLACVLAEIQSHVVISLFCVVCMLSVGCLLAVWMEILFVFCSQPFPGKAQELFSCGAADD